MIQRLTIDIPYPKASGNLTKRKIPRTKLTVAARDHDDQSTENSHRQVKPLEATPQTYVPLNGLPRERPIRRHDSKRSSETEVTEKKQQTRRASTSNLYPRAR